MGWLLSKVRGRILAVYGRLEIVISQWSIDYESLEIDHFPRFGETNAHFAFLTCWRTGPCKLAGNR